MGSGDEVDARAGAFLDAIKPFRTVVVRGGVLAASASTPTPSPGWPRCRRATCCSASWPAASSSPLSNMASLLAAPLRNLGYALQQVAAKDSRLEQPDFTP